MNKWAPMLLKFHKTSTVTFSKKTENTCKPLKLQPQIHSIFNISTRVCRILSNTELKLSIKRQSRVMNKRQQKIVTSFLIMSSRRQTKQNKCTNILTVSGTTQSTITSDHLSHLVRLSRQWIMQVGKPPIPECKQPLSVAGTQNTGAVGP